MEYTENICVVCGAELDYDKDTAMCCVNCLRDATGKIGPFLIENYRPKNMGEQIAAAIALAEAADIYVGVLLKALEAAEAKMS